MEKEQCKAILKTIKCFYHNFEITNDMAGAWYMILKNYDYEKTMKVLEHYVTFQKFPPTIADLVAEQQSRKMSQSDQTVDDVIKNRDKPFEEKKKEIDDHFSKMGYKIDW